MLMISVDTDIIVRFMFCGYFFYFEMNEWLFFCVREILFSIVPTSSINACFYLPLLNLLPICPVSATTNPNATIIFEKTSGACVRL